MRGVVLALALLCAAPMARADTALFLNDDLARQAPCSALDGGNPNNDPVIAERITMVRYACHLPVDDIDAAAAQAALGDQRVAVRREGDTFTVFARTNGAAPHLSASLRGPMHRVGQSEFAAARLRLADLDRAMITVFLPGVSDELLTWRGPHAPAAPRFERELLGEVREATLASAALSETRRLAIYLPPGHRADGDYPALFMADGSEGSVQYYARIIEPLIRDGACRRLSLSARRPGNKALSKTARLWGPTFARSIICRTFAAIRCGFPRICASSAKSSSRSPCATMA